MLTHGVPATPFLSSEIDFILPVVVAADADQARIVIGPEAAGTVLARPPPAILMSGGYSRLTGIVGSENESEVKQLHLYPKGCDVPSRPLNDDLVREHGLTPPAAQGHHRLIIIDVEKGRYLF